MTKIISCSLSNFESHKETKVDFSDGVNCLIGESEQGKSAILRAIYWVAFNKPNGEEFRSHWGGTTKVELTTDTVKIIREKGDKLNRYTLESLKDGSKLHFNGFGQTVPAEITQALNLEPINVQTQFDGHFLLPPVSSGEVAKQINQYVNLEIIDTSQSNIGSMVRELDKDIQLKKEAFTVLSSEINDKYAHLDDAEKQLKSIENTEKRLNSLIDQQANLEELILTHESIDLTLYKNIENAEKALSELKKLNKLCEENTRQLDQLRGLIFSHEMLSKRLKGFKNVKNRETDIRSLSDLTAEIDRNREAFNKLEELLISYRRINENITQINRKIQEEETQIESLMPKGSKCPLCGNVVK